ncbi:PucR family transcriptional regulator [Arthrobacter pigmenti]
MSKQLSVSHLLSHSANGGLNILVGDENTLWPDVVVEFSESRFPNHVEGALAILTAPPPRDAWQQDALIRRMRDRGFRALAMPGAGSFGKGTQVLAVRLGLVLLSVERPMELARACWQLLQGRDSLTLDFVRKISHSFEYRADRLSDLLRVLASNIGYGIALVASDGVVLQAGGELPVELLNEISFGPWVDTVSTAHGDAASVRVDSPSRAGLRLAVFGNGLSDTQLNALSVAAEVMMPGIAARLLIDEVADVNDATAASGLLRDFLEQYPVADAELEQRMQDRGWRTGGYHVAFRVTGRSHLDTFQLLRMMKQELAEIKTDSHAVISGRGVTGWLRFQGPPVPQDLEAQVTRLRRMHHNLRIALNVATGIGTLDSGRAGLYTSINGANDAARIAMNRSAAGWFVRIDALGLEQLLLSWTENDRFVPAAKSLLAPLQRDGAKLLTTISSYLDHESSISATAEAMDLHRNTVAARIHRVQDLLGLDLTDPETRLAVHLACRALQE